MRIGFLVNDVKTEEGNFTTSRLGQAGSQSRARGLGDGRRRFGLRPGWHDDPAREPLGPKSKYGTSESYTADSAGQEMASVAESPWTTLMC